jgi:hypothetical protein
MATVDFALPQLLVESPEHGLMAGEVLRGTDLGVVHLLVRLPVTLPIVDLAGARLEAQRDADNPPQGSDMVMIATRSV